MEETRMSHPCCPNLVVWQPWSAGPLGAHIDSVAHQLLDQGDASWTAKYMVRLLADLSRWLQRHALTATDLNEQRVDAFLQDRYQRCHTHRNDRPVLRRLLGQLREPGVIPVPAVETTTRACDRLACDFQHSWLHQRGLAPTTVRDSLDTVRRFLGERFGSEPLRLEALCPQDVTTFMWPQARRSSPAHAQLLATALRSCFRLFLQRGAIANDLANAVPTVPNWRLSALPTCMKAEDVEHLLQSCDRTTRHGQRDSALVFLLARLG